MMMARKRILIIINYRADKVASRLIKAANIRADVAEQHYLSMETKREIDFKKSIEAVTKMKEASKRRNNQVIQGTILKCRGLIETAREVFVAARNVINETEVKAQDINDLHDELNKLKIKLGKPEGAIGDNKIKAERGLRDINNFSAQLDKISRETMMSDIIQ